MHITLPIAVGYKPDINLTNIIAANYPNIFGASSFRSTPCDLVKLSAHFFNNDNFIKPEYREKIIASIRPKTFEVVTKQDVYRWRAKIGLSIEKHAFNMDENNVVTLYGHGGWEDGHATFVVFLPSESCAYCCSVTKTQGLHLFRG